MDKILLAMLLFRRSTIYEIHNFIKEHMKPICSDSMGSIQAGLKKLLDNNYIGYEEITENNKKKKIYYATENGTDVFLQWIQKPVAPFKNKNIDFSKIFFMGYLPLDKRIKLLQDSITNLEEEQKFYNSIKFFSKEEAEKQLKHTYQRFEHDDLTRSNMKYIAQSDDLTKIIQDTFDIQFLGLEYAIARNEFEIKWYKNFLNDLLKKEGKENE